MDSLSMLKWRIWILNVNNPDSDYKFSVLLGIGVFRGDY